MKRFLIFCFALFVALPVVAQVFPEELSFSGGYPITSEGSVMACKTETRNTPWSMAPPNGEMGYIGHIEIVESVSDEATIIAIDWDPWFYRRDGTRLFAISWLTRDLFEWNEDCGCYFKQTNKSEGSYVAFEAFKYVPAWVEQSPLPSGVIVSGCLEEKFEVAPPWTIWYEEYPGCVWTEFTLSAAPQVEQQRKGNSQRRKGLQQQRK